MEFSHFEHEAKKTAAYPNIGANLSYPTLGLAGETGEVAEKVKKLYRDDNGVLSDDRKRAIVRELGDVLWYVTMIAHELGVSLEDVARANLEKLRERQRRDMIHGNGDDR